jgi:glutamate synthase domain-containing protein 3
MTDLDRHLLTEAQTTIDTGAPLHLTLPVNTSDCAVGAALAQAIADRYGDQGLPEGTVSITFHGSAGQRFGAFNIPGIKLKLIGKAGDYLGQGMCGGQIVMRPTLKSQLVVDDGVVVGNSVLDGATGGKLFVAGHAGEDFAVRNNGATAVVEGIGDGGCKEMSNGVVVVLGQTGADFAAGMLGGLAFVLDEGHDLPQHLNPKTVQSLPVTEQADVELLKHLVSRHVRLTGSARGQAILDDWSSRLGMFWKVVPIVGSAGGQPAVQKFLSTMETQ